MKTSFGRFVLFVTVFAFDNPVTSLADISTGLLHHWPLDETAGSIGYDVVGSNNVALGGYQLGDPSWVQGRIGGALQFSRVTNYALTNSPINMNQYTISFWSQLTARSGINPRLATPQESGWVAAEFEHNIGIGIFGVRDLNEPILGEWEHYAITFDQPSGAAKTYRDGQLVRSGTTSLPPAVERWMFGHNGDPSNQNDSWNGLLDDIRIYNRLLSDTDIEELYAVPEPAPAMLIGPVACSLFWLRSRRTRRRPLATLALQLSHSANRHDAGGDRAGVDRVLPQQAAHDAATRS